MAKGRCRACGAEIVWIETRAGRMMPCDPGMLLYWEGLGGKSRIVTRDGRVLACSLKGPEGGEAGAGWVPHWASCPHSEKMKRRIAARPPEPEEEEDEQQADCGVKVGSWKGLLALLTEQEKKDRMERLLAHRRALDRMAGD